MDLTALTMCSALIPYFCINSAGLPLRGHSLTASFFKHMSRHSEMAPATQSPSPPETHKSMFRMADGSKSSTLEIEILKLAVQQNLSKTATKNKTKQMSKLQMVA